MSLRGLHGLTAATSAAQGVQWMHSVFLEADFISELRAQLLGVVAEHEVRFDMVGHSLRMDEDPRIQSNIEAAIDEGWFPEECTDCTVEDCTDVLQHVPPVACTATDLIRVPQTVPASASSGQIFSQPRQPVPVQACSTGTNSMPPQPWSVPPVVCTAVLPASPAFPALHEVPVQVRSTGSLSQLVPPVVCTATRPYSWGSVQHKVSCRPSEHSRERASPTRSSCQRAPHLLPLKVCFEVGAQTSYNALARQVNELGRQCDVDHDTQDAGANVTTWATPVSFAAIRLRLSAQVPILPEELDRPELRGLCVSSFGWYSGFRATGGVSSTSQQDRFVIFTTEYHSQVRSLRRGATLDDVVAEILGIVPRLRNIRILMDRLEGFPPLQVVATTRDCPIPGHATPLDMRPVGGRVCTLNLFPGFSSDRLSEMIMQECPEMRRPTRAFVLTLPDDTPLQRLPLLALGPDFLRGADVRRPEQVDPPAQPGVDPLAFEDGEQDDDTGLLQMQLQTWSDVSASARAETSPTALELPDRICLAEGRTNCTEEHCTAASQPVPPVACTAPDSDDMPAPAVAPSSLCRQFSQTWQSLSIHIRHPGWQVALPHSWSVPPVVCTTAHTACPALLSTQDGEQDEVTLLQTGLQQPQDSADTQPRAIFPPLLVEPTLPTLLPPSPRCPSQDGDPPSLLKRRLAGESSKMATGGQWQLYPDALLGPRYTGVVVPYTTWGKQDDATKHVFTVFDTRRHFSSISSNEATKVAEFAQRAIDTAPGPVRALQFLTVPVPGLPLPQVVLTLDSDLPDTLAIPWDCRAIGSLIRTTPHLPNEPLQNAANTLQTTIPIVADLALRVGAGSLLVMDVAGLLQDALPAELTEVQWLRIEQPIWSETLLERSHLPNMFESLQLGALAGFSRASSTTSTTTGMLREGVRIYRIRLFGDGKEASHDVQSPCPQLDLVLCLLLGKLQHTAPSSCGPANIMMAKAQPSPSGNVQEVLFLCHPANEFDMVPVFVDGRPQGGILLLADIHRLTTTENAIPDSVRGTGRFALINGAPAHLAQRNVLPGDYVQLGYSGVFVPHVAATDIMDQLPSTDVYGHLFAAQRSIDDNTFLVRIRERRRAAKVWQPLENVITIVGPAHGPVRLRLDSLFVPTVAEVREALIPLTEFNGLRLAMAHTAAQIPGAALFATVCPNSDLRTVLLPLATSPAHHIILMIPSLAEDLGYLPLDPQQRILWTFDRWRHGQILAIFTLPASMARPVHQHVRPPRPQLRETYSPGGRVVPRSGTSLVQIQDVRKASQNRCREAAKRWQVDENQPCVEGLPIEIHRKLNGIPVNVEEVPDASDEPAPLCVTAHNQHQHALGGQRAANTGLSGIPTPLGRRSLTCAGPKPSPSLCEMITSKPALAETSSLALALEPEALDYVFRPFGWESFCHTRPPAAALHPKARTFLEHLPDSCKDRPLEALQLYVDGSFIGAPSDVKAGWSIVAVGRQDSVWGWAGHLSTSCSPTGDHTTLGVAVTSAFEAELAGLVYALAVCHAFACPTVIFYDCLSAGQIVAAEATSASPTALSEAALAIHHLLWLQHRLPAFGHIKSHEGHPLNELVDSVAKLAAKMPGPSPVPSELHWASEEKALPWLWAAAGIHHSVPRPDVTGKLYDSAPCHKTTRPALSDVLPSVKPDPVEDLQLKLRAATYNAMTAASQVQRESFAHQFRNGGLHVVGIQETRVAENGRKRIGAYHVLSSSATKGEGGCQVWFATNLQVGRGPSGPVYWEPSSLSILVAEPQLMLVTAKAGGSAFAILVGHAPVNKAPAHIKEQWWQALSSTVRRVPPRATLIMCLDANARLALAGQVHPDNAWYLRDLLTAHNLVSTRPVDASGHELATWYSPTGLSMCIDYVCVPQEVADAITSRKVLQHFEGQVEHDHRPVQVELCLHRSGAKAPTKRSLNADFLRTAAGQQALRDVYRRMPPVPWQTDVDTHLGLINTFLSTELSRMCPSKAAQPRSPIVSDRTWGLIKHRRELRRELYGRKVHARQRLLRGIFRAWAGQPFLEADLDLERQYTALLVLQVADLNKSIRQHARQDSARATQAAYAEARTRGPEELASLLRHVMKSGRKYKSPPLAPAIWDHEEKCFVEGDRALGDHFAKAERAQLVSPETIATAPESSPAQGLETAPAVSVSSLAHSFNRLAHRKSPGLSGLPAEAYSQAPVAAASCHAPLLLKIALRGQMPILWRGGEAVAIAKPQKSPHSLDGWRSILLMEAAAKGVGRALRPALLSGYQQLKQPGQGGSMPKEPLQWAMALIRGFTRRLRSRGCSGGVLFLDGKQAFYATLRQALIGIEAGSTTEAIGALAERFFHDPKDRLDFVAAAVGPGLLQASGVPEVVRRIAVASLKRTWYVHGRATRWTYETFSGTTPGAPLADLYFQFLMSLVFEQVQTRIREECIEPWCPGASGQPAFRMLAPSWMDDWALPLVPPSADQLIPQARTLVTIADAALASIGIEVNYAPGKTELVPILAGKGSKKARLAMFSDNDTFQVSLPSGDVQVRVVPTYEHLGSIVTWDGTDAKDLQHRRFLARTLLKSMKRILSNAFLSERERADLIVSMPIARLRHAAGLWAFATGAEFAAFETAYMEPIRRSFRAITGITSRGRTDAEVCIGLGVLSARQTRNADLIRHAAWLLDCPDEAVGHLWFTDGTWLSNLRSALADVFCLLKLSGHGLDRLRACPSDGKSWVRRYTKLCRNQQEEARHNLLPLWQGQQKARDQGWIFVHLELAAALRTAMHTCAICERTFVTAAACKAHMRKAHQVPSEATSATFGTRCECCSKEFWTAARLREHFKTHPYCRQVALQSDITPCGTCYRAEPKTWRPAITVPGPKPWWATQRPSYDEKVNTTTIFSGWSLLSGILKRGTDADLHGFVHSALEVAVKYGLNSDDAPLALLTSRQGALLHCILFTAEHMNSGTAGKLISAPWLVTVSHERAIFVPLGGHLQVVLPSEWDSCRALL